MKLLYTISADAVPTCLPMLLNVYLGQRTFLWKGVALHASDRIDLYRELGIFFFFYGFIWRGINIVIYEKIILKVMMLMYDM